MSRLEEIKPGSQVSGVVAGATVEVVSVEWIGDQAVNLVYRSGSGSVAEISPDATSAECDLAKTRAREAINHL